MPVPIPQPQDATAEVSVPENLPPTPRPADGQSALIVDSDRELNEMLEKHFREEKWDVRVARDNPEALELASRRACDLVITGEHTTMQEDLALLRNLRLARPATRMIILTGKFTPGDVLAAIRERAFSYFARPFTTERLAEMVRIAMTEPPGDDGIQVLFAVPNWIRLRVRCDLVSANRLLQFYREASGLPAGQTEELASALREILINAMEHGTHFDRAQHVQVSYARTKRMVLFRVQDPGPGFSMEELAHSAVGNPKDNPFRHMETREAEGRRPGGFGLLIAGQLVDELIFNQSRNDVLLVRYLDRPAKVAQS